MKVKGLRLKVEGSGTRKRERRGGDGAERAKRSLKHTGARPVDGAGRGGGKAPKGGAGVFPGT